VKAAVVSSFGKPPRYGEFDDPNPQHDEILINVKAAALSQLVRAQAAGKHYSSTTTLPFVPGVDGVGRLADGKRVYFAFPRSPFGAMGQRTVVKPAMCIPLPDELDDVTAAAAANPGMSSWAALTERAGFERGESVLINGATGAAGRLAIQIAKFIGAKKVVATGRNQSSVKGLPELGADVVIALDQSPKKLVDEFRNQIKNNGVNIILDYLWGTSAESLLAALAGHASGPAAPRIRYVQIGSISGQTINLPAQVLRSSGVELLGSGLGSVSNEGLIRSIAGLMNAIIPGKFTIGAEAIPLAEVETAWIARGEGRIVFTL
jgi:NADPH:quinone reductase-like Zn-dependent oxidoreductase